MSPYPGPSGSQHSLCPKKYVHHRRVEHRFSLRLCALPIAVYNANTHLRHGEPSLAPMVSQVQGGNSSRAGAGVASSGQHQDDERQRPDGATLPSASGESGGQGAPRATGTGIRPQTLPEDAKTSPSDASVLGAEGNPLSCC